MSDIPTKLRVSDTERVMHKICVWYIIHTEERMIHIRMHKGCIYPGMDGWHIYGDERMIHIGVDNWYRYGRMIHWYSWYNWYIGRTKSKYWGARSLPDLWIEAILLRTQLRWAGHLRRMLITDCQSCVLWTVGKWWTLPGPSLKRYKDCLKANLLDCRIDPSTWESSASDRSLWRTLCYEGVSGFEQQRVAAAQEKATEKESRSLSDWRIWVPHLWRKCSANIGLFSTCVCTRTDQLIRFRRENPSHWYIWGWTIAI